MFNQIKQIEIKPREREIYFQTSNLNFKYNKQKKNKLLGNFFI